jgi:D-alanine-D-alanine ligase
MTDSPRVIVLAGGLSHERDVSLRSGRRVAEALRSVGTEVSVHDVDADLIPALRHRRPDVVWPLLHGASGEDGSIRDILELLNIAYVGTGPRASRVAWNKAVAKTVVSRAGLNTPDYVTLPQSLFRELGAHAVMAAVVAKLGLPLVVKPSRGGSALGVTMVGSAAELPQAMVDCFAYGDIALIERAVVGVELATSVITTNNGPVALPPVEIVTDGPYDYDARYNPGRTEYFTPARLSHEQTRLVSDVAIAAHTALGLRHISRTDLILESDGAIQFLEVNVAPGMTETSLFPQAALAAGYALPDLYRDIVDRAVSTQDADSHVDVAS